MKRTIILLVFVLFYGLFLPNHVFADYSQELDACNKILSKSVSDDYCTLHISAVFEGSIGNSKVVVSNAYIYPKSGVGQAAKSLEEKYKNQLKHWQTPIEDNPLTARDREIMSYTKVIEEAGPDNMKFLIKQSADEGFYTIGENIVYDFSSYLYMQQGSCFILVDGHAGRGYIKNQNNRHDDVDGDIEKLKKESIAYMNKVGNDVSKYCKKDIIKKDIIKKESPATQALIDTPPKESDFEKVSQADFRIVYPASDAAATAAPATDSASMTGGIFIGKVGDEGEMVIEMPDGEKVTLKDDKTAFEERKPIDLGRITFSGPQQIYIKEVDCSVRFRPLCSAVGDWTRCANNYSLGERVIGDCSYTNEGGPIRVWVAQGQVTFKTPGAVVVAENADFGIGFDTKTSTTIVEVYNGSVMVANKSGQSKNIATVYGSQINRIEVNQDGEMTEKIAIPQSEWEAFLAGSQQTEAERGTIRKTWPVMAVMVVLGIGGMALFLHRKGKLAPLYSKYAEKIFGSIKHLRGKKKQADAPH